MNNNYKDIRDRIPECPKWFNEYAVPRYCEFHPDNVANIYAEEVALVLIECQDCRQEFIVAFSQSVMDRVRFDMIHPGTLYQTIADKIKDKTIHYGDPPNTDCCAAGPTMNSNPIRVLEYWSKKHLDWKRDKTFEVSIE